MGYDFLYRKPCIRTRRDGIGRQESTPVVLELGGKSPCIIDKDADIEIAAKRVAWGKSLNAGQTCIAPDYIMVHEDIKDEFVAALGRAFTGLLGENPRRAGISCALSMMRIRPAHGVSERRENRLRRTYGQG